EKGLERPVLLGAGVGGADRRGRLERDRGDRLARGVDPERVLAGDAEVVEAALVRLLPLARGELVPRRVERQAETVRYLLLEAEADREDLPLARVVPLRPADDEFVLRVHVLRHEWFDERSLSHDAVRVPPGGERTAEEHDDGALPHPHGRPLSPRIARRVGEAKVGSTDEGARGIGRRLPERV